MPALLLAACLTTSTSAARAQLPADTLSLADLHAFRPATSGWRVVGGVTGDRAGAIASATGGGVLLGTGDAGASLATTWDHGDLELELDFMVPKGAHATVLLQGRYGVRLADSWGVRNPTFADDGGIGEQAPRINAGRAPGLWQTLRVRFQAPRFDAGGRKTADARFLRIEHDGVVIHEYVRVTKPSPGAAFQDERLTGPLVFAGGPIAVRHVRFKRYGGEPVRVSNLRYRAAVGEFADLAAATTATAATSARQGTADGIASALAGATDRFAMTFDGTMHVPKAGPYLFDIGFDWPDDDPQFKGTVVGGARLAIGGREVLVHEGRLPKATATVALAAGDMPFTLTFYKNRPWTNHAEVTLFVEGPGLARTALHAVQAPDLPGAITVDAADAPVVLRSFVYHGDTKRTHAASVGDPAGVHYSLDLARGALLSAWRGPFAETTEMWHDRGNDQIMRPLGSALTLSGTSALAFLPADGAPWPDGNAAADSLAFGGYALDAVGRPTFLYRLRAVDVEDRIRPADDGASLRREIRLRAPDATDRLFVRLALGRTIRRLADGAYVVDDAVYYVVPDPNTPDLVVRSTAAGQELVAPVRFRRGEATMAYTLTW